MLVFNEKEIWFHCETNPYDRFPKFEAISGSLSNFEAVFRQFVMNLSDFFGCRQLPLYMGGIIGRFLQVWCPISDSIWPLLFSHPLSGGHRTRLRIRYKSK